MTQQYLNEAAAGIATLSEFGKASPLNRPSSVRCLDPGVQTAPVVGPAGHAQVVPSPLQKFVL
ncbi:hypothetical protein [Massilia sp. DWR3-1-1]|uniref:hypothetical protein n=1 Tax=Massilia sp. DWR3-1-1 TaxID=2804559 RepID=UPI003CEB5000